MIVLVLTACPEGLRGHLTRWLYEVSAGVYVGRVSARLRDHLWELTRSNVRNGKALLVQVDRSREQGFAFRTHGHDWEPTEIEGATLMLRPRVPGSGHMRPGWSSASRHRRRH